MMQYFILLLLNLACVCFPPVASLKWHNISDPYDRGALCNDFTPAGYFLHLNRANSTRWLVFLEGGGGCTSTKQCNDRYIDQRVRKLFTDEHNEVDASAAWNAYKGDDELTATSKLMTSLWRFSSSSADSEWEVEGTDLLSTNPLENPLFSEYNHVLLPYCSSDLWIGSSNNSRKFSGNHTFIYDPMSETNQFTFRGAAIFRSVILDVLSQHGLGRPPVSS